ncbi:DUF1801 domain-containing protein [bacterium]|nr:DUF1801 domain-containing protein [bacterium]
MSACSSTEALPPDAHAEIHAYIEGLSPEWQPKALELSRILFGHLLNSTAKIWHRHPVWFDGKNPLTGFSLQKAGLRWMFWSGKSFDEPDLIPGNGRFKDASVFLQPDSILDPVQTARWLDKAWNLQWNYAEIVRNKGVLLPLKGVG